MRLDGTYFDWLVAYTITINTATNINSAFYTDEMTTYNYKVIF